jgi:hypothetical protein
MNQLTQPSDGFHYQPSPFPLARATPTSSSDRPPSSPALPSHLADILNQAMAQRGEAVTITKEQLDQIRFSQAWQCLATGLAGIVIGATAYHVLFPTVPPQTVIQEKPVIVQQEKAVIVERNCVAFCGK